MVFINGAPLWLQVRHPLAEKFPLLSLFGLRSLLWLLGAELAHQYLDSSKTLKTFFFVLDAEAFLVMVIGMVVMVTAEAWFTALAPAYDPAAQYGQLHPCFRSPGCSSSCMRSSIVEEIQRFKKGGAA